MEPTITTSQAANILGAIKDWPLWLFAATALSLTAFLYVPIFSGLVTKETCLWIAVAAVSCGIFLESRFTSIAIAIIRKYHASLEARRTFHLTPLGQQSHWGTSQLPGGTVITNLTVVMDAKNRTNMPVTLLTSRLIRPKISGEITHNFVLIENRMNNQIIQRYIPPRTVRSIVVNMGIRGLPKQRPGKVQPLPVLIAVYDDEGNQQRIRLRLRPLDPNANSLLRV